MLCAVVEPCFQRTKMLCAGKEPSFVRVVVENDNNNERSALSSSFSSFEPSSSDC